MNAKYAIAQFAAVAIVAAGSIYTSAAFAHNKTKSDITEYHMKGDAMKGDHMKGDAMKGDHMKGDATKDDIDVFNHETGA